MEDGQAWLQWQQGCKRCCCCQRCCCCKRCRGEGLARGSDPGWACAACAAGCASRRQQQQSRGAKCSRAPWLLGRRCCSQAAGGGLCSAQRLAAGSG
jgi:hypothetical protein